AEAATTSTTTEPETTTSSATTAPAAPAGLPPLPAGSVLGDAPDTTTTSVPTEDITDDVDVLEADDLSALEAEETKRQQRGDDSQTAKLVGILLALGVLAGAGWAFYHRSSRYMPA
ncbi:MAG: hypothetical protein ACRDY7_02535, partial [Acidimicrobiia bacterium]